VFLSTVSPGFSPVVDPRGIMGGKAGCACEEMRKIVAYWVNVSESAGTSSLVLSWMFSLFIV